MKWSRKSCKRSPRRRARAKSATGKFFFRALTKRFGFATTSVAIACCKLANFESAEIGPPFVCLFTSGAEQWLEQRRNTSGKGHRERSSNDHRADRPQ